MFQNVVNGRHSWQELQFQAAGAVIQLRVSQQLALRMFGPSRANVLRTHDYDSIIGEDRTP